MPSLLLFNSDIEISDDLFHSGYMIDLFTKLPSHDSVCEGACVVDVGIGGFGDSWGFGEPIPVSIELGNKDGIMLYLLAFLGADSSVDASSNEESCLIPAMMRDREISFLLFLYFDGVDEEVYKCVERCEVRKHCNPRRRG